VLERQIPLWEAVERRLTAASEEGVLAHQLAPLAALMLRRSGRAVPASWLAEERQAAVRMLAVVPVLQAVRAISDGPVVLMKGPEVALRYPEAARSFRDLDVLVPSARTTHAQLRNGGFVEVGDPELYYRLHHLRPLAWQGFPLSVEIHGVPKWPDRLRLPPPTDVIESAVPSALEIEDLRAPDPARHALLLAAHAWAHEPLRSLRDLVDVAALAAEAKPGEIDQLARWWGIEPLWRTTDAATAALVEEGSRSLAVSLWARHLPTVRERTVVEGHLQKWLSGFWALPPREAVSQLLAALRRDLLRAPEEGWKAKLARTRTALRHARVPRSTHDLQLGEEATRGRERNPPDDDDRHVATR
jgi:Uncharacterised nucleotidyltransferase